MAEHRASPQLHDDRQNRWYRECLELGRPAQILVDVGANVGRISSCFFAASHPSSKVVSIEPLAENLAPLRTRVAQAGSDRWTVIAGAVAPEPGDLRLRRSYNHIEGWNAIASDTGDLVARAAPLWVYAPDATVVKLDIEGQEYAVLEGALGRMPSVRAWALELHAVPARPLQTTLTLLATHGYTLRAASLRSDDRGGPWIARPIPSTLEWAQIPPARRRSDGASFKMLHVLASRDA